MIRTSLIAASAIAAFAMPAFAAEETQKFDSNASSAQAAAMTGAAAENQARMHLAHQGYTNISALQRDQNGRWTGVAMKDGKTIPVAVVMPQVPTAGADKTAPSAAQ